MLIILNDPTGATGKSRHSWDFERTLQANIELHLAAGGDCSLLINGAPADPLVDPRMDIPPNVADQVCVIRRPAGLDPVTLAWIAVAAIVAAVAAVALMPKIPGTSTGSQSANNSLTGQTNLARAYQGVPDVYGYRRVWPDLIQPSTVEYIGNVKNVTEWMVVSRGKGTVSAVQYADTPITDISGSSYEVFEPVTTTDYPEDGETTLLDVIETFASDEVNGQEVLYAGATNTSASYFEAVPPAALFTLTVDDNSNIQRIKDSAGTGQALVEFTYTGGTFSQTCDVEFYDSAGGDTCTIAFRRTSGTWAALYEEYVIATITPLDEYAISLGPYTLPAEGDGLWWNTVFLRGLKGDVEIDAEWWKVDTAGVEVSGSRELQHFTYTGATFDQRYFTTKVTPAAGHGRYRIQFTRLNLPREDGADVAKLEEVYAVRTYATKVLPGVTAFRVTTKATTEATGFSDRKFNLRWLRHVRELDSDTLGESRNFARSMAHMWTIAGNDIADLDTDALAAINDELGETSPLLRFDGSLDDADMSLGERMQLMADSARCILWRDGTKWTCTRDQARPYPELQLDYRNLAAGGESGISYGSHLPATNDGVELEYVDELSQSKKAYVRLNISTGAPVAGTGANLKKIKMPGCTTTAQAENRAQLEARKLLYQRTSVSDTALSDAGVLGPGALVRWIDPNDFAGDDGLQAGEVRSISGLVITTSERLDFKGETLGRIQFTGEDGALLGAPVLCSQGSTGVVLASVPAGLYVADAARQLGSRYAFGVGPSGAEMEAAGLYTVTEIKPAGDGTFFLALVAYDARIYAED